MAGLWILGLLLLIAALPVLLIHLWFRSCTFPMPFYWFLLSLLAGACSLLIAALLQWLFSCTGAPRTFSPSDGMGAFLFTIFLRIALTEETGRVLALGLLFRIGPARQGLPQPSLETGSRVSPESFGAATGLVAGLGFAFIESASYGATDIMIALLRAFTAAPLHGACGARIGMGIRTYRQTPYRALRHFLSALILHGMYNLMVIGPGIPPIIPILIAFSSILPALYLIRRH
ncbi:MAG: PrsW family intramembrane metalloprotease [Treponema sp.]|jgi:RsiW-degrading membrane proteinase PrsW (M82 family)|nr:PrsW family intramembrane metalloprotease [Treponema sp.]